MVSIKVMNYGIQMKDNKKYYKSNYPKSDYPDPTLQTSIMLEVVL